MKNAFILTTARAELFGTSKIYAQPPSFTAVYRGGGNRNLDYPPLSNFSQIPQIWITSKNNINKTGRIGNILIH